MAASDHAAAPEKAPRPRGYLWLHRGTHHAANKHSLAQLWFRYLHPALRDGRMVVHDAEVGGSLIDTAVYSQLLVPDEARTEIGAGTRVDNLVHIAHNVIIGKRCLIIAHTMLGGSVTIGDDAHIAPGSLIRDWRNVGPNATSGLGAVVITDIPDGETHAGNPARNLEVSNDRQRNRLGRAFP